VIVLISNSGHDENGKYSGGTAGDQTGKEWNIINWYNRPWNYALRYPDISVGSVIAQLAREAADNNHIGYDQSQRTTFYQQLKSVGWFPKLITKNCESDCSAGVAAIAIAVGNILGLPKLQALSPDIYTGNLRSAFSNAGFVVLTDPKYLTSDQYLLPGDILLYEGHHTAINLDKGSKATMAITNEAIKNSVAAVAKRAQAEHWPYGDDHTNPPCPPIACERGIDRGLWDLDPLFRDQRPGGETTYTIDAYLVRKGFEKNTDINKVKPNSIVFMKWTGSKAFDWRDHVFYCLIYDPKTGRCNKYDFGSNERIKAGSYFAGVPFNEWTDGEIKRTFYASYRWPEGGSMDYIFTPAVLKAGSTNGSAYLATEILKARGYKGIKKNGKLQDLELNFGWSIGDMAAATQCKLDRCRNGYSDMVKGPYGAGEVGMNDWKIMLGTELPFHAVELPTKETKGLSVLLLQEILKSRGILGADGKELSLDRQWGSNTEYAVKQYQKARGMSQTGKVTYDVWRDLLGGI